MVLICHMGFTSAPLNRLTLNYFCASSSVCRTLLRRLVYSSLFRNSIILTDFCPLGNDFTVAFHNFVHIAFERKDRYQE